MGWNDPEKGKDPWSDKKQPPDLDEVLKRMQRKFKRFVGGGKPSRRGGNQSSGEPNSGAWAVILLGAAFVLWLLSGIFIVDPAEQAVILRFGKYVETVGPGPHWIPQFISSKVVLNVDRVSDYSYSAQMLTQDENLVSVALVVQYRIGDLRQYLFNVADPQESLRQATSSALRQVVGTTTLDKLITEGREAWGNDVFDSLNSILDIYKAGIVVINVSPQPARAPENVQDAFDDAIKAQEDEKRFKEQAQAYEARVVPTAVGHAKRILAEANAFAEQSVLRAKGETAEFLELLPEYTRAPYVTGQRLYLDTMQRVLMNSSKIIVDGKAGNLMYLPLDKLALSSKTTQTSTTSSDELSSSPVSSPLDSDALLDGRTYKRSVVRQGRTN